MSIKGRLAIAAIVVAIGIGVYDLATLSADADGPSAAKAMNAEIVFAPNGFDDNDNVEVVLDGWLPSSCDKLVDPAFKLDPETLTVEVEARAVRQDGVCMPVLTRFTTVVPVGRLPMGDYKIVTNKGELTEDLMVTESTSAGPDDYVYANVTNAFVDYAPDHAAKSDSRFSVVVEGEFTDSCQRIEELRVIDSGKTFEVLPIVAKDGEACLPIMKPFVARAQMREFAEPGRYLLHVRKASGGSLNKVFDVQGQN